jgi:hypothetical protein
VINFLLANYITTINGEEMYLCLKCYVKFQAPTYAKYVVFHSPIHMNALLSEHPLYIYSHYPFKIFDCIYKIEVGFLTQVKL